MPNRLRRIGLIVVVCAGAVLGACGDGGDGDDAGDDSGAGAGSGATTTTAASAGGLDDSSRVTIVDFAFDPKDITAKAGSTIAVSNDDDAKHTFTSENAGFDVELDAGAKGTATVSTRTPGTYEFICRFHPTMTGKITVQA